MKGNVASQMVTKVMLQRFYIVPLDNKCGLSQDKYNKEIQRYHFENLSFVKVMIWSQTPSVSITITLTRVIMINHNKLHT